MEKNIFILVLLLASNLQASFLQRSTLLGGSNEDVNWEIILDASNNVYVAGYTISNDYPIVAGFQTVFYGYDGSLSKFNSDLSALLYSTYLGGTEMDSFSGVSVDANENCYFSGGTTSADFPVVSGSWDTSYNGSGDTFITKLDATGSSLLYSTYLGSGGYEYSKGNSIDANGYLYLVGPTASVYFPTTAGAVSNVYSGGDFDIFATKIDQTGTGVVYSTFIGGTAYDHPWGAPVNLNGNLYFTGYTNSTDFPTPNGWDTSFNGGPYDAFLCELNSAGSSLLYSTYLGGSSTDLGSSLAVTGNIDVYLTGYTNSTDFPTSVGAYDTSHNGYLDVFVTKFSLNTFFGPVYSTFVGGSDQDLGLGITVDNLGKTYVVGESYSSTSFPLVNEETGFPGFSEGIIFILNETGTALDFSTLFYSTGSDVVFQIAMNSDYTAFYVTGATTFGTGFPVVQGAYDETYNGGKDTFVSKFKTVLPNLTSTTPAGWDFPIVPRNDALADGTVSSTLDGNQNTTYVSIALKNDGTADAYNQNQNYLGKLLVDDSYGIAFIQNPNIDVWAGETILVPNYYLPLSVKGGRHTLVETLDPYNYVTELNENDNVYSKQFVWSPEVLTASVPYSSAAPTPQATTGANFYNCNGYTVHQGALYSWEWKAVGMLPENSTDDYDLKLFNDYSDSQNGFQTSLVGSTLFNGLTEIALFYEGAGIPATDYFAGVFNYTGSSATGNYTIETVTSNYLAQPGTSVETLDAGHILKLYSVSLNAGTTYYFVLDHLGGTTQVEVSLYDPTSGFENSFSYVAAGTPNGNDRLLNYTPTTSGDHAFLVYKEGSAMLNLSASYRINLGTAPQTLQKINVSNLPAGLQTTIFYTKGGATFSESVGNGLWEDYVDDGTTLSVSDVVNVATNERFAAIQSSWVTGNSTTVYDANYFYHQWGNSFETFVVGTDLTPLNFATLYYTNLGNFESISIFGNTPFGVWSDDGATVSFSNSTAGSSGSERWKINDNLTDYSLGAISSGGNLYGATYYDQILATVTLNGTSPTNTTDIVERAYYGGTLTENGLFNGWSGFVNKGTNLSFSGTTSQGWVTSDATTFNSLVPFSGTITYVQSGSPPESLTIQKVGNDAVLNWNAVTGVTTYKIYGNTNPDFVPTVSDLLGSSVTTSFTHTNGISANTLFFYKVTAVTASAVSKKATETEK